ncbi:hypothetical protein [Phytoactinopolyspora halotolerans]|uniref:PD(D/E)XK endonuclease domain-containing protein n=1 Tax=Phytoactinopolyspora halotolerans TaxID=1981512 RepID=A0A6L9SG05_9ACTN|nr:hypothetical protein [Phytoactinopolyspora halotolerans]NEE04007.1 hypothetical protein [Phytoactinopolyspora halotolerans]
MAEALGLAKSSTNRVRHHAERLELDTSHFRGKRKWSDQELRTAVAEEDSWAGVNRRLGLVDSYESRVKIKGHAIRLGLDVSHLSQRAYAPPSPKPLFREAPDPKRLRIAAEPIAVAWFTMHGMSVAVPSEPREYDVLVTFPDGIKRVQIKSTTSRASDGKWQVGIGRRPYSLDKSARKVPYDPDLLDYFLVINGMGDIYLLPVGALAGRTGIVLDSYPEYKVGSTASLFAPSP